MFANMKRFIAFMLALVMIFALLPANALPVDAIDEPKEISEEAYDKADLVFDLIDQSESRPTKKNATQTEKTEDAIAIVMASESYVEGSLERNGNAFSWWTEDGIRCMYNPKMREEREDFTPENAINEIVNEPVATKGGYPLGNQVYLVGPYYGLDKDFTDQYKKEAQRVANAIGDTDGYTLLSGSAATVDKVAEAISNGAVVFFDSHGCTDYVNEYNDLDCITQATSSYLCLTSEKGLTDEDFDDGAGYTDDGCAVNGAVIANHMKKNSPGGILWMAICLGMGTDGMWKPMREMGVEVVYGYSESVTFQGDYLFEDVFWEEMIAGKTVAESIATMKSTWGNWDWSTQIAKYYNSNDGYSTISAARKDFCAFPVVVSDEDAFPGQRTGGSNYGADSLQTVKSTYTLFNDCDHDWSDATCAAPQTCSLCGRTQGSTLPHTDKDSNELCDVCGADLSADVYVKVTTEPNDWSGQYLIVYEDGSVAFDGSLTSLDAVNNTVDVTISGDQIVLPKGSADYYFVINASGNGYTIQSASGYYIGRTTNKNGLDTSTGSGDINELSIGNDGDVNIIGSGGAYLRFNAALDQMRFRYYKSTSYSSQKPIALYKLQEGSSGTDTPDQPDVPDQPDEPTECQHVWDNGVQTVAPTTSTAGVMTYTCTLCGATKTESIPALPSVPTGTVTAILDFGELGMENGEDFFDATDDCVTVTADIGTGSTPPRYYTGGYALRLYGGNVLTIYPEAGFKITKITFTTVSGYTLVSTSATFTNATVSGLEQTTTIAIPVDGTQPVTLTRGAGSGHYRIVSIEIEYESLAHEHAYQEVVTAPTCVAEGYTTYTCACGESYVDNKVPATGEHTYVDGVCTGCGAVEEVVPTIDENLTIVGKDMLLGGYIGAQFTVNPEATGAYDSVYIVVVFDGQEFTYNVPLFEGAHVFEHRVAPKYMGEALQITAYGVKGEEVIPGVTVEWSIKDGIMERLAKFYPYIKYEQYKNRCILLVDMLYYGAEAQVRFGTNGNGLVTDGLDAGYAALKTATEPTIEKVNTATQTASNQLYQVNLGVEDAVQMQFTFRLKVEDYSQYVVKITANGTTYEYTGESFIPQGDTSTLKKFVTVVFDKLEAVNMRDDVTIELWQNGAKVSDTYTASIEGFATASIAAGNNVNLLKAMITYGDSAKVSLG